MAKLIAVLAAAGTPIALSGARADAKVEIATRWARW
jgi:hypothetical protein